MSSLLVLMTTHKREEICLRSLSALRDAASEAELELHVFLANSGGRRLELRKPELSDLNINELLTTDDTYWASGMRLAWEEAVESGRYFDYVLWLNDDAFLDVDSLNTLARILANGADIAVGSSRTSSGELSFRGLRKRHWLLPLHLRRIPPDEAQKAPDTFSGNVVFTHFDTLQKLGGFPQGYTHSRADLDFGLSASKRGYVIEMSRRPVAICDPNFERITYSSLRTNSIRARLNAINQPKFGPFREHVRFSMRHGGILAPFYAIAPVIRAIICR